MSTATSTNPVVTNLVTRFKFQLKQLTEGTDEAQKTAKERIPLIMREAKQKDVILPHPIELGYGVDDAMFDPLLTREGAEDPVPTNSDESETTNMSTAPATPVAGATENKKDKLARLNAERKAQLAQAKKDKQAEKAAKPKREKKVIEPHDCLCGCNLTLTKDGKFAPGHDAKLKSLIQKIERGEVGIESLPTIAATVTKFKKGDLLQEKDEKTGKVTKKTQLFICTESPVKLPNH